MRTTKGFYLSTVAALGFAVLLAASPAQLNAQSAVAIDNDDIGGVVSGPNGPEAGVWVIAETADLPTRYAKMVVTDEQSRYVVPDLPKGKYKVWVRGYGLVDSPKLDTEPGKNVNLTAVPAPNAAAAAQYYPAIYWYSMLEIPGSDQFGGKSDIPDRVKQIDWLNLMKNNGCVGCHQLGQLATRTIPSAFQDAGSGREQWMRRIQSGQAGELMINIIAGQLGAAPLNYFADWTDRIAKGELPHTTPKRPEGIERNIVVTTWDWSDEKKYMHDLIASDRRHPTVNAYGPLFGSPEYSTDDIPILDPVKNATTNYKAPAREGAPEALGPGHAAMANPLAPSAYWGEEKIWDTKVNNHNSMFDKQGRLWSAAAFRGSNNPDFCKKGSDHPSAKLFPLERTNRTLTMLDPKSMKYTFVDTCFGTHHLQFGYDANDTLWTSGGGEAVGWLNTKMFDETGDAAKAQGWTALVLDTNGNGKRDDYVEPNQPVDPSKDKRVLAGMYGIGVDPNDGSIWGSVLAMPGGVSRIIPGDNPPATTLAEYYEVPYNDPRTPYSGFGPRGGDIDRNGVMWVPLASGHMASFDRKKCKGPLNGPTVANGRHCPEGWTLYPFPGPQFENIKDEPGAVQSSYQMFVDQFDTFGLGKNVPMATGNMSDSIEALVDGTFVSLRVPYPMGFHAKGLDGRIDDHNGGWKGRA